MTTLITPSDDSLAVRPLPLSRVLELHLPLPSRPVWLSRRAIPLLEDFPKGATFILVTQI